MKSPTLNTAQRVALAVQHLPEVASTLGEAVRYLRNANKFSLRQLAKMIHVSPAFLSDLEHGRRATNKIARLSAALGVPSSVLEDYDGRLPKEVLDWIAANPDVAAALRRRCKPSELHLKESSDTCKHVWQMTGFTLDTTKAGRLVIHIHQCCDRCDSMRIRWWTYNVELDVWQCSRKEKVPQ